MQKNAHNYLNDRYMKIFYDDEYVRQYQSLKAPLTFPIPTEAHVKTWQQYKELSRKLGVWEVLRTRLVQLQFPIQAGISQTAVYQSATKRGAQSSPNTHGYGLVLQQPEALELHIHQGIAGQIPILVAGNHSDFVSLIRALLKKNEPAPIPRSMGAAMISGYNNWDRILAYRVKWETNHPERQSEYAWQTELKCLIPQKQYYQDRFIVLSNGFYSDVPAAKVGLSEDEWRQLSFKIRLEHECTHYLTKRLFGLMRHHIFDELLADYAGIVVANGQYRADWFLRFMGMDTYPHYREGGRLQNYLNGISLQSALFTVIQAQLRAAALNLERFDHLIEPEPRTLRRQALIIITICCFTLDQLASENAPIWLSQTLTKIEAQFGGQT